MIPILLIGAAYLIGKTIKGESYSDGGSIPLLAPNGKPSNLTLEQWHLVRTPKFKAWFGDWENDAKNASKVVDINGEPLVKWRGDNNPKNVFDYINYGGHGVYYFGDINFAESFGFILTNYFVLCKNPFLPNKLTKKQENEIRELWKNKANSLLIKIVKKQGFKSLQDFLDNYYLLKIGFNINSEPIEILMYQLKNGINYFLLEEAEIIEWIKNNKYDGYESYEGNYDNIAVFSPTQIKLADGTNTTFDGSNPDIRYEEGGKLDIRLEYIDFDNESDDIDVYEADEAASKIAKDNNINILRDKDLKTVALDKDNNVIGALWTSLIGDEFSFDIAVDKSFQRKGVGEKLLKEAFSEFNTYDDEGNLKYKVDVVNPSMEKLLFKYGFIVDEKVMGHTIMIHPTNNPSIKK